MRAHANISSMHNAGAGLLRWGAEALAAIALLALVGSAHAAPIKLGFINSLTGPGALVGEAAQAGVEFAVKEINEQGGIAGRPLELIVADDQTNPTSGVNEAKRLIQQVKIDVLVGPAYSQVTLASMPLLARAKIASINGSGIEKLTPEIAPYSFSNLVSSDAQAAMIVDYVKTHLKASSVAIISDTGAQAKVAVAAMTKSLEANEVRIAGVQDYQYGTADMTPQLMHLRRNKPDALILFATTGDDTGHVLKGLEEMGWDIAVAGSYGTSLAEAGIKIAGKAAYRNLAGVNYAAWAYCKEGTLPERNRQLIEGLQQLRPNVASRLPFNYVSLWYDSVYLLKNAIEGTGGSTDGPTIARWIEENAHSFTGISSKLNASASNHFLIGENNLAMIKPSERSAEGMQKRVDCP